MKIKKCKGCGAKFYPSGKNHYVSREPMESGMTAALKSNEPKMYDTFDCPYCGCQIVIQERKYRMNTNEVKENEKKN